MTRRLLPPPSSLPQSILLLTQLVRHNPGFACIFESFAQQNKDQLAASPKQSGASNSVSSNVAMKCLQQWIRSGTWLLLLSLLANHAIGIERNHGACDDSSIFTHEQHEAFQRDGFLVVSKLLDGALLDQLSRIARVFASENKNAQGYFTSQKKGVIFNGGIGGVANATSTTTIKTKLGSVSTKLFRDVALYSALPKAAAELMQLDPSTQNVRVLR
jgi:hypothetical protein